MVQFFHSLVGFFLLFVQYCVWEYQEKKEEHFAKQIFDIAKLEMKSIFVRCYVQQLIQNNFNGSK